MASIKERNGKYCVIYNYVNPKGKRKQKWETFSTKAEAKARKGLHRGPSYQAPFFS